MQVRCVGFQLSTNQTKAPILKFLSSLSTLPKKSKQLLNQFRILLIHNQADRGFLKGVVFSFSDRKTYLEFVSKGGKRLVQKRTYDNPPVEANFFVINCNTLKGIYLQYRGSLSALNFGAILGQQYSKFAYPLTGKKRNKLRFELLYSRESFDEILDRQLDDISSVEFDASEVYTSQSQFDPAKRITKSCRVKFGFNAELNKSGLLRSIVDFARTQDLSFGKVYGTFNGASRSIDIFENVDLFHVEDFDDLVEHMEAGVDDFQDAPVLEFLINLVENDDRIIK